MVLPQSYHTVTPSHQREYVKLILFVSTRVPTTPSWNLSHPHRDSFRPPSYLKPEGFSKNFDFLLSNSLQICINKMYGFEALTFNIHGGYLEAIVRGYRSGLLTAADYNNLCQCETLDDIKMHLSATEYGPYLQNGKSVLYPEKRIILNLIWKRELQLVFNCWNGQ